MTAEPFSIGELMVLFYNHFRQRYDEDTSSVMTAAVINDLLSEEP